MGKLPVSRRYNRLPLLPSDPGGIQQELAAQDLPANKISKISFHTKIPVNNIYLHKHYIKRIIMKNEAPSIGNLALTYGLYLGIALILVSLAYYLTDNIFAKSTQWANYAVMICGIVLAQINYRKRLGGTMFYGQALGVGILTVLFASVITALYTYILYELIDPSLNDQVILTMEEQLITQENLPEEQINLIIKMLSAFQKPAVRAIMGIISGTFTGLILSLITSIFTQKKPDEITQ